MEVPSIIKLQDSYRAVFDSPDGQSVLEHMKRKFHVKSSTFAQDPHVTAFREGQRYVVLTIMSFLEKDQRELIKHLELQEQQER